MSCKVWDKKEDWMTICREMYINSDILDLSLGNMDRSLNN